MKGAEAIVAEQVAAYNAQDMEAFVGCFHQDAQYIRWPGTLVLEGHRAIRERYGALWASAPKLKAQILNRIALGRFVVDLEELHFHPDADRPPVMVVYEIEDDLIRRFRTITQQT